jgi:hypothetical protein
MTRKHKTNGRRPKSSIHRRVQAMAAAGLVEDQIALRIGGDKNQLRRKYIDSIKAGRDAKAKEKAAAEAAELSRSERARLYAIKQSFNSPWYSKETGNIIFGGTHSVEEAIAWCEQTAPGCKWVTTGLREDQYEPLRPKGGRPKASKKPRPVHEVRTPDLLED